MRPASGDAVTLAGVNRIVLIPSTTPDGRHVVLRAVELTPAERLRRLVRKLRARH
jgi:hypothetical protein